MTTRVPNCRVGGVVLLTLVAILVSPVRASGAPVSPRELQLQAIECRLDRLEREYRELREAREARRPESLARAESALSELRRLGHQLEVWLERSEREPYRRNLGRFLRDLETRLGRLDVRLRAPLADDRSVPASASVKLVRPKPAPPASTRASAEVGAPANDHCAGAAIVGEGTLSGDTTYATVDGESACGASIAGPDVWFRYTASEAGEVIFDTFGAAFDTVLSLHSGCPGTPDNELDCNDDAEGVQSELRRVMVAGEEVLVRLGGFAGDYGTFLLAIQRPAELAGVIIDAATGEGLADATVTVYAANGSTEGQVGTTASGAYVATGLRPGVHFARASKYRYETLLYDDIPCPYGCDPTTGTPIVLTSGEVSSADFALHRGSAIEGRVTSEATGEPLESVRVRVYDDSGAYQSSDDTDDNGDYEVYGLSPGTYFARAESDAGHLGELWDDIPCPVDCTLTLGTPIVLGVDHTAQADFVLPLGGSISGRVTGAITARPLESYVTLRDEQGGWVGSRYSDSSGVFTFAGLAGGSYRAVASANGYLDQLYDGLPCETGCDPQGGTPIPVTVGAETTGVDFALVRGAAFSGLVSDAAFGVPVEFVSVHAWDGGGTWRGQGSSGLWGNYAVGGLTAGSYFATTENNQGYLDELHDDLPCAHGACVPAAGTPIAVATSMNTTGIDFALDLGGAISGTVTEVAHGEPVWGQVRIWDSAGVEVDDPYTQDGGYRVGGLSTGVYFVTSDTWGEWADELYDDLPCEPSCDPTAGTPVAVTEGTETSGIDLALCGGPSLQAFFPPSHHPESFIDGCRLQIGGVAASYHLGCAAVASVHWYWDDGKENDSPFPAAHMYEPGHEWVRVRVEAFDALGLDSQSIEKELHLWNCLVPGACGYPETRELDNLSLDTTELLEACTDVWLGPGFHLQDPADVTIRAGGTVTLRNGVYLEGGRLAIETDPALLP